MLIRRIIAYVIVLAIVVVLRFTPPLTIVEPDYDQELSIPSPALGQMIANAVHRSVTDPYFKPLEKLASYMRDNPDLQEIDIDRLTKWATDDSFPICFVWDIRSGSIKIDQPASPWVMEQIAKHIEEALQIDNPTGQLYINKFESDEQLYWLGFFRIPRGNVLTNQTAGVFFSIDRYLDEDVPRLIDDLVNAPRFPLAAFQKPQPPIHGEKDGDISFRILDSEGEIYLQRGRTFSADGMIYSESKYYLEPIVCLQEDWDLQVFSTNRMKEVDQPKRSKIFDGFLVAAILALSLLYWWGVGFPNRE